MSHELFRAIERLAIWKPKNVAPEHQKPAVRVYCENSGQTWALQIRGPLNLANGAAGRDFVIAQANLTREDLIALRDSANVLLKEE